MAPPIDAACAFSQKHPALADQPTAVDFIDNRLPAYHPALRDLPPFDPVLRRFSAAPKGNMQRPTSSADPRPLWDSNFPVAMSRLRLCREPKGLQASKYRIRGANDWDDVQVRLQAAQTAYVEAVGIRHWIRRSRRVVADNSQVGIQITSFVPGSEMTSPVVNVIQSLLEVIQNASKVRHRVLESFDDVDKTIKTVEYSLSMFPLDSEVKEHAVDLMVTILSAVEQVVVFYQKPLTKKVFAALGRGEEYQEEVLQGLTDIGTKSKELAEQVERSYKIYSRQEIRKADRLNRNTNDMTRTIDQRTSNMEGKVENIASMIFHLLDDNERRKQEEWAAKKRVAELERTNQWLAQTVRSITPTPTPVQVSVMAWQPPGARPPAQFQMITQEDLWKIMQVNDEVEKIDMDSVQDKQAGMPSSERGKAGNIVRTTEFRSWITSTRPEALLLHGHGTTLGGVSALSMLCSILTRTLRLRPNFLAVTHFCGLHEDEDERYYGGIAMLRSFVSQLLCQQRFNLNSIQHSVDLAAVELGQMAAICQTFGWLVSQLSEETTLICIIDEIGYYERDAAIDETFEVMDYISQLMRSPGIRTTIKIFATSTIAVREMREFFPEESVLDLSSVSSSGILSSDGLQRELEAD